MTTRGYPSTRARLERAIKAADKVGKVAVLRPNGSIVFANIPVGENPLADIARLVPASDGSEPSKWGGHQGVRPVRIDLPYLVRDRDARGNVGIYVRKDGRKIRIRERPGTEGFAQAYQAYNVASPEPRAEALGIKRLIGWLAGVEGQ